MEEELLMEYGLVKFEPKDLSNEMIFEMVRAKAMFDSYSYAEALEFYGSLNKELQEHIFMSTGMNALVYYDLAYTLIEINSLFLSSESTLNFIEVVDHFNRNETDALLAISRTPRALMMLVYKKLLMDNLIPEEEQREILLYVYMDNEYQFDVEFFGKLFEDTKSNADDLLELYKKLNLTDDSEVSIYRGEDTKSNEYTDSLSWTLDLKIAHFFNKRFTKDGHALYSAKVKAKDILGYIDSRNEEEVIVKSSSIYNVIEF